MYEDIKAQFNEVIAYSQNIPDPKTGSLFLRWEAAKSKFIHAFGDNLIYEWPQEVTFELSQKEKESRISDFIDTVQNTYNNIPLAQFISDNKEGFFSNQVIKSCSSDIPIGMKLLKAFKCFESDEKKLSAIQMAASMIIQEDKIKGRLCLSVHPLDFLSLSENCHNWRSCHALDGEYRSGNLSYMTDSSTVICYLKSSSNHERRENKLPNFPEDVKWNSKKWRVLLFFSEKNEMMFAGRQYPFSTETGLDFIREKVLPESGLGFWDDWKSDKIKAYNDMVFSSPYIPIYKGLYPMKQIVGNQEGALQYNDLLYSNCYDPVYAFNSKKNVIIFDRPPKFDIGRAVTCLRCGEQKIEISDSMMCNDCELKYGDSENDIFAICPCCGERFFADDGYWVEDEEDIICPSCADEYTDCCCYCGNRYYKDDLYYSKKDDDFVCKYCREEEEEYGSWYNGED